MFLYFKYIFIKKLVLLALPLLFLTGCSLTNNQPTVEPETTIVPVETSPIASTTFDSSNIVVEWPEICYDGECHIEWSYVYKNILPFKNGFIWIQMWGQDWYGISLIYIENWKIIKTSDDIFWYDMRYTYKKIYEYCELPLDKCTLVKTIDSCITDENTWNATDCINKAFEYIFNLIQWNEINNYFTERLKDFKNSL